MKNTYLILFILLSQQVLFSQETLPEGGGEYILQKESSCLSEIQRNDIQTRIQDSRQTLKKEGKLQEAESNMIVAFDWPLQKATGLTFNSYYGVSNFVDHDPVATGSQYGSSNLDYNCGNRTYDTNSGYNHQGTDYILWPFPWYMYDNSFVEVVAGEAGTIILKDDGNDDDHCSCSGNWNAVYIQHVDGSTAWYGHLKKNELTAKTVGQSVSKGEYLGVVASSGCSTGPHLHFEVYDNSNNLIDPYSGNCNSMNSSSWWASQPAYREPTVNALLTHDAVPVHGCPGTNESPNIENTYHPGETIYMAAYYHDQTVGDVSDFKIRRPDNSIWDSWSQTSPNTYNVSWWYWSRVLPSNGPFGTWTFEIQFNGSTVSHNFQYIDPNACVDNIIVSYDPSNLEIVKADQTIVTQGPVNILNGFDVEFRGGTSITLTEGFRTYGNSKFLAMIENCTNTNPFISQTTREDYVSIQDAEKEQVNKKINNIFISPNPTNGIVNLNGENISNIKVLDSLGKMYDKKLQGNSSLDLSDLPSGIYFLIIKSNGNIFSKKILKI